MTIFEENLGRFFCDNRQALSDNLDEEALLLFLAKVFRIPTQSFEDQTMAFLQGINGTETAALNKTCSWDTIGSAVRKTNKQ